MILIDNLGFEEMMVRSRAACLSLREDDDGLKRDVLTHAGNRWSLGIVQALRVSGTLRYAELARRLTGVTHRMLTRSLRQLERDGLIARHDHSEVPPRVDYTLAELGRGLLTGMMPLWTWVISNAPAFRSARDRFEQRKDVDGKEAGDICCRTFEVVDLASRAVQRISCTRGVAESMRERTSRNGRYAQQRSLDRAAIISDSTVAVRVSYMIATSIF